MSQINHRTILDNGPYRDLSIDDTDPEIVLRLYGFMLRLRRCEEALINEYHPADEMRCPVHFTIGQEAVPAALSLLIQPEDFLMSHHRGHGYFLAKGAPMKSLFGELYGRESGANGGLAGSQDISMSSVRFYSGAIVAGAIAIASGTALACQLEGRNNVTVAGFGEAATEEGIFWETINYAVIRKLPIIFICENNGYSMFSHQLKRQPSDNISQRVAAFGVKTHSLFGNDVISVYQTLTDALDHARNGQGPVFVEAYTYRWNSHVGPEDDDNMDYRSMSELEFWKDNCPIALLEDQMVAHGILTPDIKTSITNEIDSEIADSFSSAKSSPFQQDLDWNSANYNTESPMADRVLPEILSSDFPHSQDFTVPAPY